jgi:MoxR-like ATPase
MEWSNVEHVREELIKQDYLSTYAIDLSVYLSSKLNKPLLIEGPPGVGKTEIAKCLANISKVDLIRLQCYEGLGAEHAIYEWNYQSQLLALRLMESQQNSIEEKEAHIFSEKFLLKRPLLQSISNDESPVLLIDELDRADEEFESYLLEILSDWQISVPELGTIKAKTIPTVIITSNRTRELSEALRRRCIYMWIDYPEFEKELEILQTKMPDINNKLAKQICLFMKELRQLQLKKSPSIAETLDWAFALSELHFDHLDKQVVEDTLGIVLKDWQDHREAQDSLSELLDRVGVVQKLPS